MRIQVVLSATILTVFVAGGVRGRAAASGADLTAIFRCSSTTACPTSDRIQGDGFAYDSANGADVKFDLSGAFTFKMPGGTGTMARFIFLDFSSLVASGAVPPPFIAGSTSSATIFSSPLDSSGRQLKNGFNDMAPGETRRTSFRIAFPAPNGNGTSWFVWFQPNQYAGSQLITATRSATSPSTWTLQAAPTSDPTTGQVAGLANNNYTHKTTTTDAGLYNVPFAMTFCTTASITPSGTCPQ
jgi:hypothetical protein